MFTLVLSFELVLVFVFVLVDVLVFADVLVFTFVLLLLFVDVLVVLDVLVVVILVFVSCPNRGKLATAKMISSNFFSCHTPLLRYFITPHLTRLSEPGV